jgi:hypothetical protein
VTAVLESFAAAVDRLGEALAASESDLNRVYRRLPGHLAPLRDLATRLGAL